MKEIYISVDIETDGPIPGVYSMLSLGAAAFKPDGTLISTFSVNLKTLSGAKEHPDTMKWWKSQKEAWEAHRKKTIDPKAGMERFVKWTKGLTSSGEKLVCVGYPAGFDFTFLYWYLINFVDYSPFSFSCLDIKTYAMAVLGTNYRDTTKRNFPKRWFPKVKHTHIAEEDAIEQGMLFCNILKERNKNE